MGEIIESVIKYFIVHVLRKEPKKERVDICVQLFKFGLVGVFNNLVYYLFYVLLSYIGMHYLIANTIGFIISVVNSYYWNNKYVFVSAGERVWWKTLIKTFLSYAITGIVISNILLYIFIEIIGIKDIIAPLICLVIIIPANYILNKHWAYR